jgi:hypothetical protein
MFTADARLTADSLHTADGYLGAITADAVLTCDSGIITADGSVGAVVTPPAVGGAAGKKRKPRPFVIAPMLEPLGPIENDEALVLMLL